MSILRTFLNRSQIRKKSSFLHTTQENFHLKLNVINDMEAEYGHNLKTSFELKHAILGKDTVTFIGEIQKLHDPLPEIQFLLKEGWEHASQEAGVKSKSECKGMEIILN